MSCKTKGYRRVVTLTVAADASQAYKLLDLPLADPLLTIARGDAKRVPLYVGVELSTDGTNYVNAWGISLQSGASTWWRVPRSAASIRISATGASAVCRLAILEASE